MSIDYSYYGHIFISASVKFQSRLFATSSCSGLKRDTQNIHPVICRKLNTNIVVLNSESSKKLRPKLAKPKPNLESQDAILLAKKVFLAAKRQLEANQNLPLISPQSLNPPLPAAHLV